MSIAGRFMISFTSGAHTNFLIFFHVRKRTLVTMKVEENGEKDETNGAAQAERLTDDDGHFSKSADLLFADSPGPIQITSK